MPNNPTRGEKVYPNFIDEVLSRQIPSYEVDQVRRVVRAAYDFGKEGAESRLSESQKQAEAARKYIEFLELHWGIPERLGYKEREEYLASFSQEKKP